MSADDPVVFRPDRSGGLTLRHIGLIAAGFFLFVQVALLEGMVERIAFAAVFGVFLAVGLVLWLRSARTWPQEIRLSRRGVSYSSMRAMHGVDLVPWQEVERIDLFHQERMPPFLRIGLRDGAFRDRLRKPSLTCLGFGFDVNIPVEVDADPQVVLETATTLWEASCRRPRA